MSEHATQAKIETFNVGPPLATEASLAGGELWIQTRNVATPAPSWQSKDLHNWSSDELIIAPRLGKGAVFCYTQQDQLIGTTTSTIIARYLAELHMPADIQIRPWHDRIATQITVDRGSPNITISTPNTEPQFRYADLSEFVGSAIHAVFHVVKETRLGDITSVRCLTNDPKPYPL